MIIAIIIIRKDVFVAKVIIFVIIVVIIVVITITKDLLASEDDFLCDPVAIVKEAVVGQGVLEHVDLSRPLERP